jgi:hypothetical protein
MGIPPFPQQFTSATHQAMLDPGPVSPHHRDWVSLATAG